MGTNRMKSLEIPHQIMTTIEIFGEKLYRLRKDIGDSGDATYSVQNFTDDDIWCAPEDGQGGPFETFDEAFKGLVAYMGNILDMHDQASLEVVLEDN